MRKNKISSKQNKLLKYWWKILKRFKTHYPNLYNVLVEERNEYMAKALVDIMKKHPDSKILAVIGAGHEDELALLVESKLKGDTYSFTVG